MREKQTEKFWKDNDIFKKSMDSRKEGETYTFYDGPPTANGKPYWTRFNSCYKRLIPRYPDNESTYGSKKSRLGYHGLPVELEVEKMLGLRWKRPD